MKGNFMKKIDKTQICIILSIGAIIIGQTISSSRIKTKNTEIETLKSQIEYQQHRTEYLKEAFETVSQINEIFKEDISNLKEQNTELENQILTLENEKDLLITDPLTYYQQTSKQVKNISTTKYSQEDLTYLWRMIETETYQCDFLSKTHVASVALNRVKSNRFPNTPKEVVTAQNQFVYSRTKISEDTKLALEYVLKHGDNTDGALFFHSGEYTSTFNGAKYIFTDTAGHHFYK
jgi:predicted RNase H-like nuclease (RuvC/YqgF family)